MVASSALLFVGGCAIGQLVGGMAASAHRAGSTTIKAKYSGLVDKNFAVVIAADRAIQADFPDLVPLLTREVTRRLSENAGASGVVPADEVLKFQFQRPGWVAMPLEELAKELDVDRLVYIDLRDFALTEPGNTYIYSGVASGVVNVVETGLGIASDNFAFTESIRVRFPDSQGMSPLQIPKAQVFGELARRFIDRASWLFYEHEEPNVIKY